MWELYETSELPPSRPPFVWKRLWRRLRWPAFIAGGFAITALGAMLALNMALARMAPQFPFGSDLYAFNRPASYAFMDRKGQRLGVRGAVVGERLKLSEMPSYLPAAFLAIEDRRFYDHGGYDPRGLMRAAMADWKAGRYVQGGSTITQQLVRMLVLTPERTMSRKLTEIAGSEALEQKLSKNEILELYLNRVYLGSGAYGVDGAAHVYFGKSARDVTLSEAAMLAALTRAPSAFSPRRDLPAAQERAGRVLSAMVEAGNLTEAQVAESRAHPATIIGMKTELAHGYFLDTAADEAKKLAPNAGGDLTIVTTYDATMQQTAESAIAAVMDKKGAQVKASQAAMVVMEPGGAVRALVGGRSYADSIFNRATQAMRQPGSSFKPFVYLAAIERGLTPSTIRVDEPIEIKGWAPDNFSQSHIGAVTLSDAFAKSINSVAVQLGQEVGMKRVIEVAQRLGVQSPLEPNPSLALGTSEVTLYEMTGAYGAFASGGYRATPHTVESITSADHTVIFERKPPAARKVIDDTNMLAMNGMLYQVVKAGTGRAASVPGHEIGGKTGTSTDFHDAWFIGFTPQLVAGVWVGNDNSSSMKKVTGGSLPAQIWNGFMKVTLKGMPAVRLPRLDPPPPAPVPEPDIAADMPQQNRDGLQRFGDNVGDFLDRLFGSRSDYRQEAAPMPQRSEPRNGFSRNEPPQSDASRANADMARADMPGSQADMRSQPAPAQMSRSETPYADMPRNDQPRPQMRAQNRPPRYDDRDYANRGNDPANGPRYGERAYRPYDPRSDERRTARVYDPPPRPRDDRYYDRYYDDRGNYDPGPYYGPRYAERPYYYNDR